MNKGEVWLLKDDNDNGRVVAWFECTDGTYTMDGNCYIPCSWHTDGTPFESHFLASVYCKWDGCTHWHFMGEDYRTYNSDNHDSYYHICGEYCFVDHVRAMCFVWKLACMHNVSLHADSGVEEYYYGMEKIKALSDLMLDGYSIVKEKQK
ncbi:hypothetical protein [Fibrobacter sp.]|uniref:hypothetical protein n=1 Tax=Fibrobacter sp. TaxID=35828 RepID=UPI003890E3D9